LEEQVKVKKPERHIEEYFEMIALVWQARALNNRNILCSIVAKF